MGREIGNGVGMLVFTRGGVPPASSETPGMMMKIAVAIFVKEEEGKLSKVKLNSYLRKW